MKINKIAATLALSVVFSAHAEAACNLKVKDLAGKWIYYQTNVWQSNGSGQPNISWCDIEVAKTKASATVAPYEGLCWLSPPKGPAGGTGVEVKLPAGSNTVTIDPDTCEAVFVQKMPMGDSTFYATLAKDKKTWVGYWTNGGGTGKAPDYGVTNGVKR